MHLDLTAEESCWYDQLVTAVRCRDRRGCLQAIAELERALGCDNAASLLTEFMAHLSPVDFSASIWLLACVEPGQAGPLAQPLPERTIAMAPEHPSVTILATYGDYALGLDRQRRGGIVLLYLPTGEPLGIFGDGGTAVDAVLALERRTGASA